MKKIIALALCLSMFFLVSCSSSTGKTNNPENADADVITVKHHNYYAIKDPFDYRYAHQKEEEIFNMLNRKDKEGIKAMFSEKVRSENNLDKQIDILFDYITEPIIDYEESLMSSGKEKADGNIINWDFANTPIAITKSHRYYFSFGFIYKDDEQPQNIGVKTLCVWDEKFDEHWNDIFDSQDWPTGNYEEGCFCFLNDGNIIV